MRLRRGTTRIPDEIVEVLESDRAQVVREIVEDAGERAVRLAEEATSAALSAHRVLPSVGGVIAVLLRRDRGRGGRVRTALLLALGAIVVVGIVIAARRRGGAGADDERRERAMDDALMDSFPASDPPAPATAPRV